MSDLSLVSVIVPIYKIRDAYLEKSIESILNQTFRNLEVFLVDDGSPDNCGQICDRYAGIDNRICVIHQSNMGVSAARNAGLLRAKGDYIAFVDPDDYLQPDYIEMLMEHFPAEADIISCCCRVIGTDFVEEDHFYDGDRIFQEASERDSMDIQNSNIPVFDKKELYFQLMDPRYGHKDKMFIAIGVPWGKLFRRDFLRQNELSFDVGLPRMQDNLFNMYAFSRARSIYYWDEPLYNYRYEHISGFGQKSGKDYKQIFTAVIRARHQCLIDIDLMGNDQIRQFYYYESSELLISILYRSVFHPDVQIRYKDKRRIAMELLSEEPFREIVNEYRPDLFKQKIYVWIMRQNLWMLFNILSIRRSRKEEKLSKAGK